MKLSFLASHGGSSARQIITAISEGELVGYEIGILITNNKDAAIYQWCIDNQITVHHISAKTHPDHEDQAIRDCLLESRTDLVVLSGYMKKIGPLTLSTFADKILNIHPSLLPKHGGQGKYGNYVHASVLQSGDRVSGASVHRVNGAYDEGPVLLQEEVPVYPDDTVETLGQRVRAIEAGLYINVLKAIAVR
ncbi:phosphoribosylglycinamide formyltransferase [Methylicorpusculum sp.]|uniref:phosphoribosylglycinamide formyltransferase n=1 Tax=Methylicorpusculum sp. TaxID=2713644 RepID=UPI0027311B7F|nr:phosphoribosylglycinamide formyltransferase [Methylicorpusculum sp.]MDP2180101.1 phosphoribosylglycinamide formyltransferase [Methylicorpusculum sp.]MDP3530654.1 phosphoribosylglycinamide formyltransferase [Methylicorpusculum sp.]MDZ4149766.1 phosphoribosylglycinamide formyltransferase [Methylicorpusculum sp.]